MRVSIYIITGLLLQAISMNAQTVLYNDGGLLSAGKGAVIHVEGDIQNKSTATMKNDGVIQLMGDFTNDPTAILSNGADSTSTERIYKFIGTGTQAIKGNVSDATDRYFYNLLIDKAVSGTAVELQTDATVKGSLVFGSSTSGAATYTPTAISTLTDNSNKGIIKTYDGSNTDYELFVTNSAADAVKGYAALSINGNPTDAFIQNRGAQGVGVGGFARNVSSTSVPYVFPVGTVENGYNATALTFSAVGGGTDKVRSMFVDATGGVGSVSQFCSGCLGLAPDNTGFNYYFPSSSCNGGTPQWIIFDALPDDHGYWSYEGDPGDHYVIEAFPNSFPAFQGDASDSWRLLKKSATIDAVPSGDWTPSITSSVTDTGDLVTYTRMQVAMPETEYRAELTAAFRTFKWAELLTATHCRWNFSI